MPSAAVAVCGVGGGAVCPGRSLPRGGGVCPGRCLPSLSRGVSAQGGVCPGTPPPRGQNIFLTHACENITFLQLRLRMVIITACKRSCGKVMFSEVFVHREVSVQGGLCLGGSLSRGSLSGGLCPGGSQSGRPPRTVTSGRYVSYWNAFLSVIFP